VNRRSWDCYNCWHTGYIYVFSLAVKLFSASLAGEMIYRWVDDLSLGRYLSLVRRSISRWWDILLWWDIYRWWDIPHWWDIPYWWGIFAGKFAPKWYSDHHLGINWYRGYDGGTMDDWKARKLDKVDETGFYLYRICPIRDQRERKQPTMQQPAATSRKPWQMREKRRRWHPKPLRSDSPVLPALNIPVTSSWCV
jgi:hypothetical protein